MDTAGVTDVGNVYEDVCGTIWGGVGSNFGEFLSGSAVIPSASPIYHSLSSFEIQLLFKK